MFEKCFNFYPHNFKFCAVKKHVYIKDFDRFMFHKTKNKTKKWFCRSCLQCFNSEDMLTKRKKDCLSINGKQSVKLDEGSIVISNKYQFHLKFMLILSVI